MYCKKCNRLIKNSSEKCPYCDFDNTVEINIVSNELKEKKIKNLTIIACYDYNEVKNDIQEIVTKYDEILNTLGINNI